MNNGNCESVLSSHDVNKIFPIFLKYPKTFRSKFPHQNRVRGVKLMNGYVMALKYLQVIKEAKPMHYNKQILGS
jgi:hypothetical protein